MYNHDVFLSYPHGFIEDWINTHFLPLFRFHLEGAIGGVPKIFIDREGISTGDTWPLRLKEALCHSKCLVSVWSPSYFNSDWCVRECCVMLNREREEGYRTIENPRGLVIPINVSDGACFPDYARIIQHFDCRDFAIKGPAFEQTILYVEFQQKIRSWVSDVADAINYAPTWKNDWLSDPALDIPEPQLPTINPPVLE